MDNSNKRGGLTNTGIGLFAVIGIVGLLSGFSILNSNSGKTLGTETTIIPTEVIQITNAPTNQPTAIPTSTPTNVPTAVPTLKPTSKPAPTSKPVQQQAHPCAGASALCNDGTCSYSAHRQGTYSHHGGVAIWNP